MAQSHSKSRRTAQELLRLLPSGVAGLSMSLASADASAIALFSFFWYFQFLNVAIGSKPKYRPCHMSIDRRLSESMRERVTLLGGTLMIDSTPGRGTVVRAEVPWKANSTPFGS